MSDEKKELEKKYYPIYWRIVTDTEDDIEIKDVNFADGLLIIVLGKIIPEHHAKKVYL